MVPQAYNIIDDRNDQLTVPNVGFVERGGKAMKGPLSKYRHLYRNMVISIYRICCHGWPAAFPIEIVPQGGDKSGEYVTIKSISQSSSKD